MPYYEDDCPPPFSSLHEKRKEDATRTAHMNGWCHFTTQSLCKNVGQVEPFSDESKIHETQENKISAFNTPRDSHESSATICNATTAKTGIVRKNKLFQHLNLITSISSILLIVLLMISQWWPNIYGGVNSFGNSTAVTYTNVIITPCGNYFWHSAGGDRGNWVSSDVAIKQDEEVLEETSNIGIDWGYNRILGKNISFYELERFHTLKIYPSSVLFCYNLIALKPYVMNYLQNYHLGMQT